MLPCRLLGTFFTFPSHPQQARCFSPLCRDWFGRALQLLVGAGRLWEATPPAAIAGFAVTREAAEAALKDQPAGAFLLR